MKKILTVCGLGQGTSLILKMNVEQAYTDQGARVDVENTDLSAASGMSADYIFTSRELADSLKDHSAEVIVVNNFFDMDEITSAVSNTIN